MKRSLKELIGYTIQATDGEKGKVYDILFDDETWIIRYVEADLGNLIFPKKSFNSPFLFARAIVGRKTFSDRTVGGKN
jgi:hypothetical protein